MKKAALTTVAVLFVLAMFLSSTAMAGEGRSEMSEAAEISQEQGLEFAGAPVMSNSGKLLGSTEQIIFDQTGRASYLLLSATEQPGVIAIPIEKVQIVEGASDKKWLSVSHDEEKIMNAPSFDSVEAFTMPGTRVKVRSYFDME